MSDLVIEFVDELPPAQRVRRRAAREAKRMTSGAFSWTYEDVGARCIDRYRRLKVEREGRQ